MSLVPPLAEASGGTSGEATVESISSTVLRSAQMFFAKWFGLQTIRIGNLPRVQTKVDPLIRIAELSIRSGPYGFRGSCSYEVFRPSEWLSGYVRGGLSGGITMTSSSLLSLFAWRLA